MILGVPILKHFRVSFYFRSLAQMSILFGQVVRGLSAGSRVFEVNFLLDIDGH